MWTARLPETPQQPPCCSTNISSIVLLQVFVLAVPPSWSAFHPDIHMICSFILSDLCWKVTLIILHKIAQFQHTRKSLSPFPAFLTPTGLLLAWHTKRVHLLIVFIFHKKCKFYGGRGSDHFQCLCCQFLNTYLLNKWMNEPSAEYPSHKGDT